MNTDPLPPEEARASSSRVGKAVEYLVASACLLAGRGRLNVSTSIVDDEGVDLVFHLTGGTATLALQVKARTTDSQRVRRGSFLAEVRRQTFSVRADFFVLFVVADPDSGDFGPVWLVPSDVFDRVALRTSTGRLRLVTTIAPTSKSRWRPYRFEKSELTGAILAELHRLEATGR